MFLIAVPMISWMAGYGFRLYGYGPDPGWIAALYGMYLMSVYSISKLLRRS